MPNKINLHAKAQELFRQDKISLNDYHDLLWGGHSESDPDGPKTISMLNSRIIHSDAKNNRSRSRLR